MADQWPAFEECMPERPLIQNYWRENDGEWLELVKQRYEETRKIIGEEATQATQASAEGGQTSNQIPRIIHHIWLGSPMPERLEKMRKTWIDMHPEPKWQHRLWTDQDIAAMGLENQGALESAPNLGEAADIARYEILYRYGGIYVDVDCLCTRPLDELVDRFALFAGLSNTGTIEVNNALIGAIPYHPLLRQCISAITSAQAQEEEQSDRKHTGISSRTADTSKDKGGGVRSGSTIKGKDHNNRQKSSEASDTGKDQAEQEKSLLEALKTVAERHHEQKGRLEKEVSEQLREFTGDDIGAATAARGVRSDKHRKGTLEKTGPGMFTRQLMTYLDELQTGSGRDSGSSVAGGSGGNQRRRGSVGGPPEHPLAERQRKTSLTPEEKLFEVLILPPSFFYALGNIDMEREDWIRELRASTQHANVGGAGGEPSLERQIATAVTLPSSFSVHFWDRSWINSSSVASGSVVPTVDWNYARGIAYGARSGADEYLAHYGAGHYAPYGGHDYISVYGAGRVPY